MNRDELLTYQQKPSSSRTILSINWHPKFRHFPSILRQCYNSITTMSSKMKEIFPEPPMIAFRRNRTIRDRLVHSNHGTLPVKTKDQKETKSQIESQMNNTGMISNTNQSRKFKIAGGPCNQRNVVYAAECTRHHLLYVGQTSTPLNIRFNGHRSDISVKPEQCQLPKHFNEHGCDFEKDLRISILENQLLEKNDSFEQIKLMQSNHTAGHLNLKRDLEEKIASNKKAG